MNTTKDRRSVMAETFQRLWKDFPELWNICDHWDIGSSVPIISTLNAEILSLRVMHDEWWVVLHEGQGACQRRWIVELERQNRNLRTALKDELLLSQWSVKYIVCRPHGAHQKQQFRIYKPEKGQTINDMCFNLRNLTRS